MSTLSISLHQGDAAQRALEQPTSHPPANLPASNPTKSFWINSTPDANPLSAEGSEGTLTPDADICIIGSGITGVSAAYHLSQVIAGGKLLGEDKPFKAVIVEARDFCSGATGRNGGHLTAAAYQHFHNLQKTYGTEQAIRSLELENHTTSSLIKIIDTQNLRDVVDLAALGCIDLSLTQQEQSDAKVDLKDAKEAGVNVDSVEILSEQMMNDQYGTPYPGFRFPGHNLWPLKLVTELYKIAESCTPKFSLTLHTRTPVTSITSASPSSSSTIPCRYIINTPRGPISCSYIIHATNAYTSHLLPHFTGPEGIIPVRGQVMALRAAVGRDELGTSGWIANGSFEYWFPLPAKYDRDKERNEKSPLVVLGGGREVSTSFEVYEDDDSMTNKDVSRALKDFLPGLFQGKYVKGREPEMEWTGITGMTKMSDPFVGPVLDVDGAAERYKGQFISAGYSGDGMQRAFGCAEAVVGMLVSEITGRKWSIPGWLPERFLTWNRVRNK